ncbi:MAG: monofunctional biosynthetic peptidoglycan transglycosylase [Paludibacter sp.]|jgi:monofunctional biosynthetic peptidoglycan transglycosylase|nr:monofunctional biosynthetic peptidoglycan transglycosylase [Paludibacter sp.]
MKKQKNKSETTNSKTKKEGLWAKFVRLMRNVFLLFMIVSVSWVIVDRFVPVIVTPLMIIRSAESLIRGEMPKNSKRWVSIDKISPNMVQAVVASEDNLFLHHHGFSIEDITKAIEHNQKGRRIRGGSTISQQTAKNVFLFPQRSYIRKGLEAYFTVLIELIWNKERIMEVYLNVIEMGDGIYGVEAAAQEHFGVHASQLTRSQAALIAACLPNPRRFDAGHPSGYVQRREAHVLSIMNKIGPVNFNNEVAQKNKRKRIRK